jgi:hypothetical protein
MHDCEWTLLKALAKLKAKRMQIKGIRMGNETIIKAETNFHKFFV